MTSASKPWGVAILNGVFDASSTAARWTRTARAMGRRIGVVLGGVILFNSVLWVVAPRESLLLFIWSASTPSLAWMRVVVGASAGLGLLLVGLAGTRWRPWMGGLLVPGMAWACTDAVSIWRAAWVGDVTLGPWAVMPTSASLALIMGTVWCSRSGESSASKEAGLLRVLREGVACAGAAVVLGGLLLQQVMAFGATDYRRPADTAVIFGAAVHADGRPSQILHDRVMTGVRLYHSGHVTRLVMTGAVDQDHGQSEPEAMRALAISEGVPADAIAIDDAGINTAWSIRNVAAMQRQQGLGRVLMVSNDHHTARIRLACHRVGLACFTVPAKMRATPLREPYYIVREVAGFVYYALTYRATP